MGREVVVIDSHAWKRTIVENQSEMPNDLPQIFDPTTKFIQSRLVTLNRRNARLRDSGAFFY